MKFVSIKDVNGKTLHLVQRIPPTANQPQPQAQFQPQTGSNTTGGVNTPDVSQLIQHLIGGLGELGQNATFNTTTNVFIAIYKLIKIKNSFI